MKIKAGYLLSYDYEMFLTSVMQLYNDVDKIVVGVDEDYLTWSGNKFEISEQFFAEVKKFDIRNIIEFYFDKFYVPGLTPMECETRERNMILKKLGRGWKIQLDVDEYVYEFTTLKTFLKKYWYLTIFPRITPISFSGLWLTIFKKDNDGFFFVDNKESFSFITNQSFYTKARYNTNIWNYQTDFKVIHQSWARSSEEIKQKIENWGHRDDFDTSTYYEFWKNISHANYLEIINFHPLSPKVWDKLSFINANDIDDLIGNYARGNKQQINSFDVVNYLKSIFYKNIYKR